MYWGDDYTTTREGLAVKGVCCEKCGYEYVYLMSRSVSRSGFSFLGLENDVAIAASEHRSEIALENSLRNGCDSVPCPECGHYQEAMVRRIRRIRLQWMKTTAAYLALLGPMCVLTALVSDHWEHPPLLSEFDRLSIVWAMSAALAAAITGLLLTRYCLNYFYDPNAEDLELRQEQGRIRAISKVEFIRRYPYCKVRRIEPTIEKQTLDDNVGFEMLRRWEARNRGREHSWQESGEVLCARREPRMSFIVQRCLRGV